MASTPTPPVVNADRLSFFHGFRTALAAGLAYWLTGLLHLEDGYWAVVSSIVVMQSEVGATVTASRDRLAGTAIGAVIGWGTAHVWHRSIPLFALAVLLVMLICSALRIKNAGRLGGVAVAIIVLIPHTGTVLHVALYRFVEVSIGIVISLGVMETWSAAARLLKRKS